MQRWHWGTERKKLQSSHHWTKKKLCLKLKRIRGCYQLICPELPAQEECKNPAWPIPQGIMVWWTCSRVTVICKTTCGAGRTQQARENTCPAALIDPDLPRCSFLKCSGKAFSFKSGLCCFISRGGFCDNVFLWFILEMGFRPTDTANSIAGRCTKVPKQTGECHYLLFQ